MHTQDKYEEADPLHLRAIEIVEKARGPHHPDLATCLHNRAGLLKTQVRCEEHFQVLPDVAEHLDDAGKFYVQIVNSLHIPDSCHYSTSVHANDMAVVDAVVLLRKLHIVLP